MIQEFLDVAAMPRYRLKIFTASYIETRHQLELALMGGAEGEDDPGRDADGELCSRDKEHS